MLLRGPSQSGRPCRYGLRFPVAALFIAAIVRNRAGCPPRSGDPRPSRSRPKRQPLIRIRHFFCLQQVTSAQAPQSCACTRNLSWPTAPMESPGSEASSRFGQSHFQWSFNLDRALPPRRGRLFHLPMDWLPDATLLQARASTIHRFLCGPLAWVVSVSRSCCTQVSVENAVSASRSERNKRLFQNEYVSVAGLASRGGAVTSSSAHYPQVLPAAILQCENRVLNTSRTALHGMTLHENTGPRSPP